MLSQRHSLQPLTCLHAVDRFLERDRGAAAAGVAAPAPPPPPPPPHLSSELLRESAGEAELFLPPPPPRCSSLSRFRFFFCRLLSPCGSRGEPGVEESGVLEVRESRPDTELEAEPLLERELAVSSSAGSSSPSPSSSSSSSRTAAACVAALCGAPAMIVTATTAWIR